MRIAVTLVPLILLIGLGALLSHLQFLGKAFVADLNKLAFWIALPALLFRSAAHAGEPGVQTGQLLMILLGATILGCGAGYLLCAVFRVPSASRGTLVQAGFRGNLAYIGIPLLSFGLPAMGAGPQAFRTAVVVMTCMMVFFNFLAVLVLTRGRFDFREAARSIVTNPLLVSGLLGLAVAFSGFEIPLVFDRTLEVLGNAAVPIALLCIGGSFLTSPKGGKISWVAIAVALKIIFIPFVVWLLAGAVGLQGADLRTAMVLAVSPTAATAYVMAAKMGGDELLASGAIAASTVLCAPALFLVLWFTGG
jgi:predicted permease